MDAKSSGREKMLGTVLVAAAFITYIAITASRLLYNSEKLTLIEEGIAGLEEAAHVFNVFMVAYAVTQITLAIVMKRINLKWYILITISGASLVTSLMVFTSNIGEHYVIYALMGALQAGYWSCNLKLMSVYLPSSMLPSASAVMTMGPAIAGALSFGVAALFGNNWRLPFLVMGILSLCGVILYTLSLSSLEHVREENLKKEKKEPDRVEIPESYSFFETRWGVLIFYAISIIVGCSLISIYSIIGNNLDVYLKEIGEIDVGTVKAIMIVMPLVAAVGPFMTVHSTEKRRGDFFIVMVEYLTPSLIFIGAGCLLFRDYVVPTFILFLIFYVLIHGSRSIILSVSPLKMREKLDTGVYSIVVNAASSIASGIIPTFAATMLETNEINDGFNKVFLWMLIWTILVVVLILATWLFIRVKCQRRASLN